MADPFQTALADGTFDALGAAVAALDAPDRYRPDDPLLPEALALLDGLLVRVAKGRGALDVAVGERLAALVIGDRVLRLGVSGIGDYARERLGIAARTAQSLAQLATELRTRPLLAAAVRGGSVTPRKAAAVVPVAQGADEAAWVKRAQCETVRALEAAVKAARAEDAVADEDQDASEPWDRLDVALTAEQRAVVEEAMTVAGKLLGPTSTRCERLEAMCQESLGAFPPAGPERRDTGLATPTRNGSLEAAKAALEAETRRWSFLEDVRAVAARPAANDGAGAVADPEAALDPFELDAALRALAAQRAGWDALLGDLAKLFIRYGFWRFAAFVSFRHYCEERLGLAVRTVEQRAALARSLDALPQLRDALRAGRVSYEQARLVAEVATVETADRWIARAERTTCIALRRELEAGEATAAAQMCAPAELSVRVPRHVVELVCAAFEGVRAAAGRWLPASECLVRIAQHFIDTHRDALAGRSTPARRALERDRGRCQVPGCSRAAAQAHHVLYRSHGGGNGAENLVGLCAAHHLHGVHRGFIRVWGKAPDALHWELGVREGRAPLVVVEGR